MEEFISNSKLKKINEIYKKEKRKFIFILSIHLSIWFALFISIFSTAIFVGTNDLFAILIISIIIVSICGIGLYIYKSNFKSIKELKAYAISLLALNGKELYPIEKKENRLKLKDSIFIDKFDSITIYEGYKFNIDGYEGSFTSTSVSRSSGKSSVVVLQGYLLEFKGTFNNNFNSFLKYNNYPIKGYKAVRNDSTKRFYLFKPKNDEANIIDNYKDIYKSLNELNLCVESCLYIGKDKIEILINYKIKPVKVKQIDMETLKQFITYYDTYYSIIKKNINFINNILNK